jgi:hypothetical protein
MGQISFTNFADFLLINNPQLWHEAPHRCTMYLRLFSSIFAPFCAILHDFGLEHLIK